MERDKMSDMNFIEETVVDERAIRRLAESKGCKVSRENSMWNCCGVMLNDDEVWAVLQNYRP